MLKYVYKRRETIKYIDNINVVIKGKFKGYKIVFDETNKTIQLKHKDNTITLNRKSKINLCY